MLIGKALLLKGLGGLAALGGAIGTGWYIHNRNRNLDTKFDGGLIEFLKVGGDIQFSVKENNGSSSTDISDNFPQFTTGTDSQEKTATVTIKVSIDTTSTSGNDGTLTERSGANDGDWGTKKYLQKLNGDEAAWTWECKIVFEKPSAVTETELKDKEKLVKSADPKGFFNKLKDADTTNKDNKDLKIKFIKDCAAARGKDKNREINRKESLSVTGGVITNANQIDSNKKFKLRKGVTASGEEEGKLYPVDKSDFNYWFGIK